MKFRPKNLAALSVAVLLTAQAETRAEPVSAGIGTAAAVLAIGTAVWSGANFVGGTQAFAYAEADGIRDSDPAGATRAQIANATYPTKGGWGTASAKALADTGVTAKGTQLKTEADSQYQGPVTSGNVTFPTKQRGNMPGWYYYGWGTATTTLGWAVNRVASPAPGGINSATSVSTETVPIAVQYTVNPGTWQTDTVDGDFMNVHMGLDAYAIPDPLSAGSAPSPSGAFWQQSVLSGDANLCGGSSPSLVVTGNVLTQSMFSPLSTDANGNVNAVLGTAQVMTLTLNVQVPSTLNSFSFVIDPTLIDNVQAQGVPEPSTLAIGAIGLTLGAGRRLRRR
jgi:hypothetical protein